MKYIFAFLAGVGAWFALQYVDAQWFSISIPGHASREIVFWTVSIGAGILAMGKMD